MKIVKMLISGLMAALIILCSCVLYRPVTVEAAEPDSLPMLPDNVYGRHYFIYHTDKATVDTGDDCYYLYVMLGDFNGSSSYITFDVASYGGRDIIYVNSARTEYIYVYTSSDGWQESYTSGGSFSLLDNWTIVSSTFDVYTGKDSSDIYFAKNADIITRNSANLDKFGSLMLGSIGIFDSNFLGIMPFACMACSAVIMSIYRMGRGF